MTDEEAWRLLDAIDREGICGIGLDSVGLEGWFDAPTLRKIADVLDEYVSSNLSDLTGR